MSGSNNPDDIEFVEHRVQPQYQPILRRHTAGTEAWPDSDQLSYPQAPYGVYPAPDPQYWNPRRRHFSRWQKVPMPIQGPANWDQIWPDMAAIGHDWQEPLPQPDFERPRPLRRDELQRVRDGSEVVADIKLVGFIAQTPDSSIWVASGRWRDSGLPVKMACKLISLADVEAYHLQDKVDMSLRDVRPLVGLRHPNLCNVIDTITIGDRQTGFPYNRILILMEYCETTLGQLMNYWPNGLHDDVCLPYVADMAQGLAYLHEHRVAHMDIKPENIFTVWDQEWRQWSLKLGDFGSAMTFPTASSEQQMTAPVGTCIGTPGYTAPEMLSTSYYGSDRIQVTKCDMYSMGITWAELVFGRPTIAECGLTMVRQQLSAMIDEQPGPHPELRWVSKRMAYLIGNMIQVDPDERPPSMDDVLYILYERAHQGLHPQQYFQPSG